MGIVEIFNSEWTKYKNIKITNYLRTKFGSMEQTRKRSRGIYWLLFLASSALLAYAIYDHWEYLTLILPFQVTFFAKALDIM